MFLVPGLGSFGLPSGMVLLDRHNMPKVEVPFLQIWKLKLQGHLAGLEPMAPILSHHHLAALWPLKAGSAGPYLACGSCHIGPADLLHLPESESQEQRGA